MADMEHWKDVQTRILGSIDVESAFRDMGVRFTGKPANAKGWLECYAMGRTDAHASAACNVGTGTARGRYVDAGGTHLSLNFWEFAARFGGFSDWKAARKDFAGRAGVTLPRGSEPIPPSDRIDFVPTIPAMITMWARHKPGVTAEAAILAGARLGRHPKRAPESEAQTVVAFPYWTHLDTREEPSGWVIYAQDGGAVRIYQGKSKPPRMTKVAVVKGSDPGLLNRHALDHLEEADIVWRVEGPTDMVALLAAVAAHDGGSLLDRHVVLTSSNGSGESVYPGWLPLFAGKKVYVVGDADVPGRHGRDRWASALAPYAAEVRSVTLPFPEVESHGKDLRDYLAGTDATPPHTYHELLALAESSPAVVSAPVVAAAPSSPPVAPADEAEAVGVDMSHLASLRLHVLGRYPDGKVSVYSEETRHVHDIPNVGRMTLDDLILIAGLPARLRVHAGREEVTGLLSIGQVRTAVAHIGSRTNLIDDVPLGQGFWLVDGKPTIVNGAQVGIWADGALSIGGIPRVGSRVIDLSASDAWVDFTRLSSYLACADDPLWCLEVFGRLEAMMGMWPWQHAIDATVAAALVLCTWVQTAWPWRPMVSITGPTSVGKSTLIEDLLGRIFGKNHVVFNKPSEAGLRQTVRNNSVAIFIDEFEADQRHRQQVLELLRTTSRGGFVHRGTSDQRGKKYQLKHMPWTGAIDPGLNVEADRNRFIVLELEKLAAERFGKFHLPSPEVLGDFGIRLLAVAVRHVATAVELWHALRESSGAVKGVHGRVLESYSVPAAMIAAIRATDAAGARTVLASFFESRETRPPRAEETEIIRDIFESRIDVGPGQRRSVSQILHSDHLYRSLREYVEACGICLAVRDAPGPRAHAAASGAGTPVVFFNPSAVSRYLLVGTRWERVDIEHVLRRVPGARRAVRICDSKRVSGVEIPAGDWVRRADAPESAAEGVARLLEGM